MQSSNSIYSLYYIITRLLVEASYSSTYYHLRLWGQKRGHFVLFRNEWRRSSRRRCRAPDPKQEHLQVSNNLDHQNIVEMRTD
jgi:hypothetical protein